MKFFINILTEQIGLCLQFQMGSWVHYAQEIDIHFYQGKNHMDLTEYLGSHEWDIIENTATRTYVTYDQTR